MSQQITIAAEVLEAVLADAVEGTTRAARMTKARELVVALGAGGAVASMVTSGNFHAIAAESPRAVELLELVVAELRVTNAHLQAITGEQIERYSDVDR